MIKKIIAPAAVVIALVFGFTYANTVSAQTADAQAQAQIQVTNSQPVSHGWFANFFAKIKDFFTGHREEKQNDQGNRGKNDDRRMSPAVMGTVTAIQGSSTLLVQVRYGASASSTVDASTTVFTVDASSAKIVKGTASTTIAFSNIAVGDKVLVRGTVNGTSVVASMIIDNPIDFRGGMMGDRKEGWMGTSTRPHMNASSSIDARVKADFRGNDEGEGFNIPANVRINGSVNIDR